MKLYAELPGARARQIAADVLTVVWGIVWTRIGLRAHELVGRLAGAGAEVEDAGRGLASAARQAAENVADAPLVGTALRVPFDAVSGAGRTLAQAGQAQQDAVHTLALWVGIAVVAIPLYVVLRSYLPWRVGWIRSASQAVALRNAAADLRLFALRAVATRPLRDLRRASEDPGRDLAEGRYHALAEVELRSLGLRSRD